MKKKIVLKIGGSLLFSEKMSINTNKIIEICDIIKKRKNIDKLILIIGGGKIARTYINAIREFNKTETFGDLIGIEVSRLNCLLFNYYLGEEAYPHIPKSFNELSEALLFNRIIVMGGLQPGQSTTSVSVEVAEFIKADKIIILTDVEGIYDKDPNKFKNAKLLNQITYEELENLIIQSVNSKQAAAGEYRIFDAVSLQLVKRCNIQVHIISGRDLNYLKRLWNEESNNFGTIIKK